MMTTKIILEFVFTIYNKTNPTIFYIEKNCLCNKANLKRKDDDDELKIIVIVYNKRKRNDNELQQDYDDGNQEFIIAI
jgi:hypothetical protein